MRSILGLSNARPCHLKGAVPTGVRVGVKLKCHEAQELGKGSEHPTYKGGYRRRGRGRHQVLENKMEPKSELRRLMGTMEVCKEESADSRWE